MKESSGYLIVAIVALLALAVIALLFSFVW